MGREKRIAESRAREVLDRTANRQAGPAGRSEAVAPASGPVVSPEKHTSTAKALLEILALYLVPVVFILLIGKIIFHL
jgi:hypothetical protein